MSFAASWMPVEEGISVSGKIHAIKKSGNYKTVENCRAYAEITLRAVALCALSQMLRIWSNRG